MHLKELCGTLACDENSSTGKECPMYWGATSLSLGGTTCADADAGADGGSSSSSGGGDTPTPPESNCACSAPGAAFGGALPTLLALSTVSLLRYRRRRQRR